MFYLRSKTKENARAIVSDYSRPKKSTVSACGSKGRTRKRGRENAALAKAESVQRESADSVPTGAQIFLHARFGSESSPVDGGGAAAD
jgi:hypothetical protein